MDKAKVLYANARATTWEYDYSVPAKLEELLLRTNLSRYIQPEEYVAIKMHLGSEGAYRTVRPVFVRKVVDAVKAVGGKPFIAETTRIPGLEYLEVAAANGYSHLTCGAPIIMADGIFGRDTIQVKVEDGRLIQEIGVASAIYDAPAMIVLSHCKGHIEPGYGGAIKNLAMGGVGVRTRCNHVNRGNLHSTAHHPPLWTKENCTWCGHCEKVCPVSAITLKKGEAWIVDEEKCDQCGRCARVCTFGALEMPIGADLFSRGMAESTKAVLSTFAPGKVLYVNFVMEVQPECDCMPTADTPLVQDQGILISDDIVAIETATLDLLDKATPLPQSKAADKGITTPGDLFLRVNGQDPRLAVGYAEELGLGKSSYELVEIKKKRKSKASN